jgi:hypothetical protein
MSSVKKLKDALVYAKNLNENLDTHPIPELPKENQYAKYAKSLELQKIAIKTRDQTNKELSRDPNPPTDTKTSETTPKTKFVKEAGKRSKKSSIKHDSKDKNQTQQRQQRQRQKSVINKLK